MTVVPNFWKFQKIKDSLREITSQSSDMKQQQFDIPERIPVKELSSIVSKTWSTWAESAKLQETELKNKNFLTVLNSVTVLT
jgi:hypothetical protein